MPKYIRTALIFTFLIQTCNIEIGINEPVLDVVSSIRKLCEALGVQVVYKIDGTEITGP